MPDEVNSPSQYYYELLTPQEVGSPAELGALLSNREVFRCLFARCIVAGLIAPGGPQSYVEFVAGTEIPPDTARAVLCSTTGGDLSISLHDLLDITSQRFPGGDSAVTLSALVATSVLQRIRRGCGVTPTPQALQSLRIEAAISYEQMLLAFRLKTRVSISRMIRGTLAVPDDGWRRLCALAADRKALAAVHAAYPSGQMPLVSNSIKELKLPAQASSKLMPASVIAETGSRMVQLVNGFRAVFGGFQIGVLGGLRPSATGSSAAQYLIALKLLKHAAGFMLSEIDAVRTARPAEAASQQAVREWVIAAMECLLLVKNPLESKNIFIFSKLSQEAARLGAGADAVKSLDRKLYYLVKSSVSASTSTSKACANNTLICDVLHSMLDSATSSLNLLLLDLEHLPLTVDRSVYDDSLIADFALSIHQKLATHFHKFRSAWCSRFLDTWRATVFCAHIVKAAGNE